VTEVDGVKIGGGKRGPVTQQIQKKYKQAVSGQLSQHQDWLSFII
ncbi:MAG: branched chain amino acid aminotransferase, partial [Haemophilus parainfluenzae]